MSQLLEVKNLRTYFFTSSGVLKAVDDVSFDIREGELVSLVGESGCGKSITALSIIRLVPPPGKIVGGEILFKGEDLTKITETRMRQIRGNSIAMIFQDPMTSLNPVYTVGEQIAEVLRLHRKMNKTEAWEAAIEAMREVAIPDPAKRAKDYPHQLSGGMRQRVMIAIALACEPDLLIADEPTTALDVTIQAQILELLNELRQKKRLAVLLITHDLGVVAEVADRVCVMYTGKIVEEAAAEEIFETPRHPYTQGLLRSVPKLSFSTQERLQTIEGTVPNLANLPPGCHFAPRCQFRRVECEQREIPIKRLNGAKVRCVLY
jgi:oligopeptide/dipeptide ABC transporter ATP-binding protein